MKKFRFKLGYYINRPEIMASYKEVKKFNDQNLEFLNEYQDRMLRKLIVHAVREVPYYTNLFKSLNLKATDIKTVSDLTKLPILTKEEIKKNPELFISKQHLKKVVKGSTGGSTGTPLKYFMSNKDYSQGVALLFRGFEFGGFKMGDSMAIIAGASLVSNSPSIKTRISDWALNFKHYSSYGMSEEDLERYFIQIQNNKPKFIRGYASSIYIFAKFIREKNLTIDNYRPKAIFTTAEKLFPQQRLIIEDVFKCKVYDNYGLNDGGVSAFECKFHNGMHIDYERSILEVVSEDGINQLLNVQGKILATSLHNYTMPFIRYDTGDLGSINTSSCPCGCKRPLLKEISGRVTDYLKINNVFIGSPVLTVLMGKIDANYYQIVQTEFDKIQINLVKGKNYSASDENFIRSSLMKHVKEIKIDFNYCKDLSGFIKSENKFKFIINNNYR